MSDLDLIITNVSVVVPGADEPQALDIGVKDGRITHLEAGLSTDLADTVVDGTARSPSPGSSTPTSTGGSTTRCPRTPSARAARRPRAA